jgi:hypothetical protein
LNARIVSRVAAGAALFAVAFLATRLVLTHQRSQTVIADVDAIPQRSGAPLAAPLPGFAPGAPRAQDVPEYVWRVSPTLTLKQRAILESPLAAQLTWAAAHQAMLELVNGRLEAAFEQEHPHLPWDCLHGDEGDEPVQARVHITATPSRVVATGYRITSATLPADVVDCIESFYAGEAVVEASASHPFLELETELELLDAL